MLIYIEMNAVWIVFFVIFFMFIWSLVNFILLYNFLIFCSVMLIIAATPWRTLAELSLKTFGVDIMLSKFGSFCYLRKP